MVVVPPYPALERHIRRRAASTVPPLHPSPSTQNGAFQEGDRTRAHTRTPHISPRARGGGRPKKGRERQGSCKQGGRGQEQGTAGEAWKVEGGQKRQEGEEGEEEGEEGEEEENREVGGGRPSHGRRPS